MFEEELAGFVVFFKNTTKFRETTIVYNESQMIKLSLFGLERFCKRWQF